MNAAIGWALAAIAAGLGFAYWGIAGLALVASGIASWLLMQFTRAARVLRAASGPIGRVASAVELHARLHRGMRLTEILRRTRSLGRRVEAATGGAVERFDWTDDGGARVVATLLRGRLADWRLVRLDDLNSPPPPKEHDHVDARP